MPQVPSAHVFIDANMAMHFKRPDQIDWCTLVNANEVVLVAAPILLRELEQQKVTNGSSKLKGRAANYIKWLHPFVLHPEIEIRTGVKWLFLPDEPQLDFAAERLSQTIADDHFIASVLHYTRHSSVCAFVATADLGLEVKLRSRGIGVLELSDDLRLPAEPDPLELENKNLKRQIARIEARMPRLSVVFEGGAEDHALSLRDPSATSVTSLDQIRSDNPCMHRPQDGAAGAFADIQRLTQQFGISAERVDKYNEEREQYLRKYQDYLDRHAAWSETLCLHHQVKLVIANDGTAPALNIDLELFFPDGIWPVEEDNLLKEPKAPEVPRRPQGIMDIHGLRGADYLSRLITPDLHSMINPDYDGVPIIGRDKNSVRISYSNLKHGFSFTSDELIFRFVDAAAVRAFSVKYRLSADELPDAVEGQLHFRIDGSNA